MSDEQDFPADTATHFPAEYVTMRHNKTSGNWKIEFEFPVEIFPLVLSLIGPPPPNGESKWVAIAPLAKP